MPSFDLPKEVMSYGDSGYWNAQKRWRTADGGKLMAYTVLGNVQLLYYRADLLKAAGIAPPKTWADVARGVRQAQRSAEDRTASSCAARRATASATTGTACCSPKADRVVKDPAAGDYTVTINSPQAKAALDLYIDLLKKCGPPNYAHARPGRRDPAARDRQGRDGRRRDRGVRELRGSGQVGGRRQARDASPLPRRAQRGERRGDRQLERRASRRTCPTRRRRPRSRSRAGS